MFKISATVIRLSDGRATHEATELTAFELGGEWTLDLVPVDPAEVPRQLVLVIEPEDVAQ